MPRKLAMTTQEMLDNLRSNFSEEISAADVRAFCASQGLAYQTVTRRLEEYKSGRGKWNLNISQVKAELEHTVEAPSAVKSTPMVDIYDSLNSSLTKLDKIDVFPTPESPINSILNKSFEVYNQLLDAGVAREQARMVLPLATKTKIQMTGSIRSWIHFLELRDDEHAQKEIQLIAKAIKVQLKDELPIIAEALKF